MTKKGFTVNTWTHVEELRERQRDCEDYPVLGALEEDWAKLEPEYNDFDLNRDDLSSVSKNPIGALCYMVEMGIYPPPELLLTLVDCFNLYKDGGGTVELEEIFYGPVSKRVGNHAARFRKGLDFMGFGMELLSANKRGLSNIKVAESYVLKNGLDVDPESLLRSFRRWCVKRNPNDLERESIGTPSAGEF
jgi:hypothetical protein